MPLRPQTPAEDICADQGPWAAGSLCTLLWLTTKGSSSLSPALGPRVLLSPRALFPPPLGLTLLRITQRSGLAEGRGGGGSATARPGPASRPPSANKAEEARQQVPQKSPPRVFPEPGGSALAQAEPNTMIGLSRIEGGAQREPPISPFCPGGHVGEGKVKLHRL